MAEVVLVRHGETEWSASGRHTGRTDLPLTERGRDDARALRDVLAVHRFVLVLTSPLVRAVDTCDLSGYGDVAQRRDDLMEWDYGAYEGRTTAEIRVERSGWSLWADGCPDGESPDAVALRADRVIAELTPSDGDVLVFGHGHMLRVLGVRWIGLAPSLGRSFDLSTGSLSALGRLREDAAILRWNERLR